MDFAWRRTARAWVQFVHAKDTYTVWTTYRSRQGAALQKASKGGYVTRDEAEQDLLRFRHCVETDKAWKTNWVPISDRRDVPESTTDLFATFLRENAKTDKKRKHLLAQGSVQEQVALSAAQKKQRLGLNNGLPREDALERVWKFGRKTRDYMRMYRDLEIKVQRGEVSREDLSYDGLEKMRKVFKSHRNIIEMEGQYLMNN